ncbi:MAG: alpha/beta fold hydrolase [Rhizobiaceae bacterium]|nr:alpha/beta fold hydrolase [Rhizobiaceae bacterium]
MTSLRYLWRHCMSRTRTRRGTYGWIVFLLTATLTTLIAVRVQSAEPGGSFYNVDASVMKGAPGTIIRSEPMPFSPRGTTAYRILYRSVGLHDEPIAVSGVLVVPTRGSDLTRHIVAWAHPTTGVATVCAPSLRSTVYQQIQGLHRMLSKGYAVVATDYPGLGTAGVHPYLIGTSEGRAVLDSVRAAKTLLKQPKPAEFIVWGHSQGGQAALYTGLLADTYAPDLKLMGVAAAAPATDLSTLMRDDFASSGGKGLTALTLWSWSRIFDIPLTDTVEPNAIPTVDELASGCIETIFDLLARRVEERPLGRDFLTVTDISSAQPWNSVLTENSPGVLPRKYPVIIAQGLADTIVRPQVTVAYAQQLCANGNRTELLTLPRVGHGFIAHDSATDIVEWMARRFKGKPAPSTCGAKVPLVTSEGTAADED